MGLFTINKKEIQEKIHKEFGEDFKFYLVGFKHNSEGKKFLQLMISNMLAIWDNARTYIIAFTSKGIYEKEVSGSLSGEFALIPWNEIEEFTVEENNKHSIIKVNHLGKEYVYKIEFSGNLFVGNEERMKEIKKLNWNRVE